MIDIVPSRLWLINFYKEQLDKLKRIGVGRRTEYNVLVTHELIALTEKRLNELTIVYEAGISPFAFYQRAMAKQRKEEKLNGNINGSTNST